MDGLTSPRTGLIGWSAGIVKYSPMSMLHVPHDPSWHGSKKREKRSLCANRNRLKAWKKDTSVREQHDLCAGKGRESLRWKRATPIPIISYSHEIRLWPNAHSRPRCQRRAPSAVDLRETRLTGNVAPGLGGKWRECIPRGGGVCCT